MRQEASIQYRAAEWILDRAYSETASVMLFPETVFPIWTAATDAFWQDNLAALSAAGKTIIFGARIPLRAGAPPVPASAQDVAAALAVLRTGDAGPGTPITLPDTRKANTVPSYDNALIIRGAGHSVFRERSPVPIAMWKPFSSGGARLRLFGPRIASIRDQQAAVLICYEQLLVWPVLTSMLEHPTVIVAAANDHWATGTPIPAFQIASVRAWARLFRLPYVSAVNT